MRYQDLRKKYPRFVYQNYSWQVKKGNLEISFLFSVESGIEFQPHLKIKNIHQKRLSGININNFVFHLGMMEMPSYWKATCSPEIVIRAGSLDKEQLGWWKDLIIHGMGQFFYENKINFKKRGFIKIISESKSDRKSTVRRFSSNLKNRYLVPVGGGKDSIVTLEKLKNQKKELTAFLVNPTKAAKNILKVAGIKKPIIIERKIDPVLLKLNKKGYLNGHTPFTAVLSFISVFCAVLFNYRNIAFSNEKSANEGNVRYLGRMINHQWSKSFEFEKKFRFYIKKYLTSGVEYFSFLRKYSELEIAEMFTKYPKYFPVFSSCNIASRARERWCGECPKCLFVYAILYPYLEKKELLKIFGKDLFDDKKLLPIMKSLMGWGSYKPFECVGTYKESCISFKLSLKKALRQAQGKPLPYLLTKL